MRWDHDTTTTERRVRVLVEWRGKGWMDPRPQHFILVQRGRESGWGFCKQQQSSKAAAAAAAAEGKGQEKRRERGCISVRARGHHKGAPAHQKQEKAERQREVQEPHLIIKKQQNEQRQGVSIHHQHSLLSFFLSSSKHLITAPLRSASRWRERERARARPPPQRATAGKRPRPPPDTQSNGPARCSSGGGA